MQAQQTAALLTTFNEIDMSRRDGAAQAAPGRSSSEKYGIKLGFMSFFVKAAIDALKLVPQVNAEIRGTDIVYHNYYDIGVAVGGGKGLVVPVLRNAERLSFAEIELTIADLGGRAKENKLKLEELQGGTFTISNGGVYGSLLSTPIVNPPQSGILGLHAIQDRPWRVNGQVVIRPMMYVALTYDHRIVDGREAVTFLKRIKECDRGARRACCSRSDGMDEPYDLVVIGAGPGGYVAAIRAAQLGLNVACIEKETALGGTCLRVGCIPSKALLEVERALPRSGKRPRRLRHRASSDVELDLAAMLKRKDDVVEQLTDGVGAPVQEEQGHALRGRGRLGGPATRRGRRRETPTERRPRAAS